MATGWHKTRKTFRHGRLAEALIAAALARLEAEGIEALSLRELARDVGVNHRAVYRHFPDKLSLLARAAEEGWRLMARRIKQRIAGKAHGADILVAAGVGFFLFARDHPHLFHFMAGPRVNSEDKFPGLEVAMAETMAIFRWALADATGLSADITLVRTAIFISALQGVTAQILHRRLHVTRAQSKDFVSDICRQLLFGLSAAA